MRVFLIGFMGAGKSSVGKILAGRLRYRFVDLDDRIEKQAQLSVQAIFERWGESHFRRLEHEQLAAIAAEERVVIATGGGALTTAENRALLRGAGSVTVWLDPSFETIANRMNNANRQSRPLWASEQDARALHAARAPGYRSAADVRVEVPMNNDIESSVRAVERELGARGLGERPCAT